MPPRLLQAPSPPRWQGNGLEATACCQKGQAPRGLAAPHLNRLPPPRPAPPPSSVARRRLRSKCRRPTPASARQAAGLPAGPRRIGLQRYWASGRSAASATKAARVGERLGTPLGASPSMIRRNLGRPPPACVSHAVAAHLPCLPIPAALSSPLPPGPHPPSPLPSSPTPRIPASLACQGQHAPLAPTMACLASATRGISGHCNLVFATLACRRGVGALAFAGRGAPGSESCPRSRGPAPASSCTAGTPSPGGGSLPGQWQRLVWARRSSRTWPTWPALSSPHCAEARFHNLPRNTHCGEAVARGGWHPSAAFAPGCPFDISASAG